MKKGMLLLLLSICMLLSGCVRTLPAMSVPPQGAPTVTDAPLATPTLPTGGNAAGEEASVDPLAAILALYAQAVAQRWAGSVLAEKELCVMLSDCYGEEAATRIGYTHTDLDADGRSELIVALTEAVQDDYYGKLVLAVYTVSAEGNAAQVLCSSDRDRYYYAGDNLFMNIGAESAALSVERLCQVQDGVLQPLATSTQYATRQQLPLTPLVQGN